MTRLWHPSVFALGLFVAMGFVLIPADARASDRRQHQHDILTPADPVPGESIYQLNAALTDQNDNQTTLSTMRGHPTLITMFYTSCQSVCPVLAVTLQRIEAELTPQEQERLRVVMVSFDPHRDTTQALRAFATSRGIDDARWTLARASDDTVREIAAVLGIRYRPLPEGGFSHSATVVLLDADGVIRARTENLQQLDPQLMQALHTLLAEAPPSPTR